MKSNLGKSHILSGFKGDQIAHTLVPRLGWISPPPSYWKETEKISNRPYWVLQQNPNLKTGPTSLWPASLLMGNDQGPRRDCATHFLICKISFFMTAQRCWEGRWGHGHDIDFVRTMLVFPSKLKLSVMGPISDSAPLLSVSAGLGEAQKRSRKMLFPQRDLRKTVSFDQHCSLPSVMDPFGSQPMAFSEKHLQMH